MVEFFSKINGLDLLNGGLLFATDVRRFNTCFSTLFSET